MIQMHEHIQGKIQDPNLRMGNSNGLGIAYQYIGKIKESITFLAEGLNTAQETKNRGWEGAFLGNLGLAHIDLGNPRKSIDFHERQLINGKETGDRRREGIALGNLGSAYAALGDARKAIEFHEQALVITREIGDRSSEGADLSNIAGQYSNLAEYDKAIDYYAQALQNAREIGNKYGESKRLNGLAGVLIEKGDIQNAITHSTESLQIGREMSSSEVCIESGHTLATALLLSEKFNDALQVVQEAGKFNRDTFNFNVSALHGLIVLRQGDEITARQAFTRAIAQADEILAKTPDYYSALDAKGLALCGLALTVGADLRVRPGQTHQSAPTEINNAIETFRQARKIAPHAGIVKATLRLFDELVKCDEAGVLKNVRAAVEGKK